MATWKISKEAFDALPDQISKEDLYTIDGESATLKLEGEGAPSTAAVAKAEDKLRIEKEHRKNAEAARDAADANSEKFRKDLDNASGKEDIEKLKQELIEAREKVRTDREAELKASEEKADSDMIRGAAEKFIRDNIIDGPGDYMIEPFAKTLAIETVNGEKVVRVKESVLSMNEHQAQFLANEKIASIVKAKAGSGGGANPSSGGGAATKQLSEMTGTEEAQYANANPEAYAAMVAKG